MGIKIHQNDYIAPAVERPANATNKLEGLSNFVSNVSDFVGKLAGAMNESQDQASRQKANKATSDYKVESEIKLKELKASGAPDIKEKMAEWQENYKKEVLERNKDDAIFTKLWNENVYKVDNPLKLSVYESQLEVDSVNEANYRNEQLQNNVLSTRLNPNLLSNNAEMSFNSVDDSKFLTFEQRNKEFDNIARQQQTTAYLATADKSGVQEANRQLLAGDFDLVYFDKNNKIHNYNMVGKGINSGDRFDKKGNFVTTTLIKSAEDSDIKAILESDNIKLLEATKKEFDKGKRYGKGDTYSIEGVGVIWNKEEKQHFYHQLNQAIKNSKIRLDDAIKSQKVDLYISAQNGDYVAAQTIKKMAEGGDKFAKKSYKALQETVPEMVETSQDAFNGFAKRVRDLASIDVNKPVSMGEMSGKTRYKTVLWDTLQYLEDRNHITKDLSPEDKKLWSDMVVTLNENIGQNITSLVDGLMTAKDAVNAYNVFINTQSGNVDMAVSSRDLPAPSDIMKAAEDYNLVKYNKKQDDFISNKFIRSIFAIEKTYAGATDPIMLQRKEALMNEAKESFLTEKRLQVAPELYHADSTSKYKIHKPGDTITINNRNYELKGYKDLIFPILAPVKK